MDVTEPLNRQESRTLQGKGRTAVKKNFEALAALEIEWVKPESVYPNAYNPNRQDEREFELLLASMREDGFTQPIVVQRKTREIVDGEHRWRAAQHLGLEEIPVVFVDMSAQQARISTLRHNRARGSEDVELTIKILQDLRTLGALEHAVDSLQISDRELNALIDDLPVSETQAGESFSQAWRPGPGEVAKETKINGANQIESASTKTINATERRMAAAGKPEEEVTPDERNISKIWTVVLQFNPKNMERVLAFLGPNQADGMVRLMRRHEEAMREDEAATV